MVHIFPDAPASPPRSKEKEISMRLLCARVKTILNEFARHWDCHSFLVTTLTCIEYNDAKLHPSLSSPHRDHLANECQNPTTWPVPKLNFSNEQIRTAENEWHGYFCEKF